MCDRTNVMNSALWPGNAVLVSVLLLVNRRIWPLIAAAFAAFVLYDLQTGVSLRSTGLLILADGLEVLIAALCLNHFFRGVPQLNSVRSLVKYLFFAAILRQWLKRSPARFRLKETTFWRRSG
jgi:integral membrane sensor domain MASE1